MSVGGFHGSVVDVSNIFGDNDVSLATLQKF